jgi:transposase
MLNIHEIESVYLATGTTDLRKSIDGLAIIVKEQFDLDPFSSSLFIFCNKSRNRIKALYWDYNGFWLIVKRLERGKFKWPNDEKETIKIDLDELKWLLDGYEIRRGKVFKKVTQKAVI